MNLQHRFQSAEFRGVPFQVASGDTTVGRRAVVHEFPKREKPSPEDLGRKASEFVVEGFIIGPDYREGMKRLMAALQQPGQGKLVHPSHGELQVVLLNPARLREQFIERRGMVTFSLTFVEAGEERSQPSVSVDTQQAVEDAADAAYGPMEDQFASEFSVDGAPAWSVDSITGEIGRVGDAVSSVRDGLQLDMSSLSSLVRSGSILKSNVTGLLSTPRALASELTSLVRGVADVFDFSAAQTQIFGSKQHVKRPVEALLPLGSYGQQGTSTARPTIPETTPVRRQQAANQKAVFSLVAQSAVVEAVRSSVYIPFYSAEESIVLRDQLYDALDALMMDAPDPVYHALHELRSAMVRDVTARGADMARLSSITLPASLPARVLSYRLYGTGAYADEIVARNQAPATVMHPLFVPGGTALGVRRV